MDKLKKYWFTIEKKENDFLSGKLVFIFAFCKKKAIEKLKREYKTAKEGFIYNGFTHI